MLDLGLGAAHFEMFEKAEGVCREALQLGERHGQGSVVILADRYLAAAVESHNPDAAGMPEGVTAGQRGPEQLAESMTALLRTTESFASE